MVFVKIQKLSDSYTIVFSGVSLRAFSKEKVRKFVSSFLDGDIFHRIATVGPEFLLRAREDEDFKKNLLRADLRVVDGFGITLAGWLHGKHVPRFPGADLLREILKEAEARNLSVFLAVRKDGLSSLQEIQRALLKKYPNIRIQGKEFTNKPDSQFLISHSDIVFCNFGAPEQEYFLESLRGRTKSVRLVMGVGGAFDFLTGKLPRAPKVFRILGLEWLWRLFLQPKRWRRIWRALVVFPMLVIKEKFFSIRHSRPASSGGI